MDNKNRVEYEIAVILPAYNEELTIQQTIEKFRKYLPNAYVVVVDNASEDRTSELANKALENHVESGCVLYEPTKGKANAVRKAFHEINAKIYLMCDADLTYPIERCHELIAPALEGKADLVIGDRLSNGSYKEVNNRQFHGFGNRLVRWLINFVFRAEMKDIMSGYRVISHRFVKNYPILVDGFQLETDMTLHALSRRFDIVEIPVQYESRPEGSVSKLNTFNDGFRVLKTIFNIFRLHKPMIFFGMLALFFCCLGLLVSIPVFHDWFKHNYIYHVPSAILASVLELVGFLMMSVGLILENHAYFQKANFEQQLLDYSNNQRKR